MQRFYAKAASTLPSAHDLERQLMLPKLLVGAIGDARAMRLGLTPSRMTLSGS